LQHPSPELTREISLEGVSWYEGIRLYLLDVNEKSEELVKVEGRLNFLHVSKDFE
jgi:hypothetical protein